MGKVTFKQDGLSIEVAPGIKLRDVCDENGCSVPFGCGNGVCGTCMSTVEKGAENLEPASASELDTLSGFNAKPNQRLVCQCRYKGPGEVVINNE